MESGRMTEKKILKLSEMDRRVLGMHFANRDESKESEMARKILGMNPRRYTTDSASQQVYS